MPGSPPQATVRAERPHQIGSRPKRSGSVRGPALPGGSEGPVGRLTFSVLSGQADTWRGVAGLVTRRDEERTTCPPALTLHGYRGTVADQHEPRATA